ncbi:MAG: AAA family ATPase [Lautropia sp.]
MSDLAAVAADGETLFGRGLEQQALGARLEAAVQGKGSLVLLAGEAGIGKTSLARDLARRAAAAGLSVAWGRCREDRGAPALWPWRQILRSLGLDQALQVPEATLTDASTTASRQFRRFERVVDALGGAARPLCLLLDDVHRADEESLALLLHLADGIEERRLLVMATLRPHEIREGGPLGRLLGNLGAHPATDYRTLGPLDPEASSALLRSVAAARHDDASHRATVLARAAGNPFFLEQLIRASPARPELPLTVREAVLAQAGMLSADAPDMLGACAVLGRDFDAPSIGEALGVDPMILAARLVEAQRAGLVEPTDGGWRFRHVLVRDALYESLAPDKRRRLHAMFAGRPPPPAPTADDWIARAHHAREARRLGEPIDSALPCWQAGKALAQAQGHDEAATWFDRALEDDRSAAPDPLPSPSAAVATGAGAPSPSRTTLLLDAGDAHLRAGRATVARQRFEAAFALADAATAVPRPDGEGETLEEQDARSAKAAAALSVGRCVVTAGAVDWSLVRLLERAGEPADRVAADTRARLLARHGIEVYWEDGPLARRLSDRAAALVGPATPAKSRAEVMFAQLFCLRGTDRLSDRVAIGRALVDLAVREQLGDEAFRGRAWLIPELLQVPDLPAYDAQVDALARLARQTGEPLHHWYADLYQAQAALVRGDHAAGQALAASALTHGLRAQAAVAPVYHLGQTHQARRDLGGLATLLEPLHALSARFPAFATLRALRALVLAELGHRDEAAGEVTRLSHQRFDRVPRDSLWVATLCLCAETAHRCAMADTGRLLAQLLAPHAGSCAVQGLPCCYGAVDLYRGLALAAAGERPASLAALEAAVAQHRRAGFEPLRIRSELALIRVGLARSVAASDGRSDLSSAGGFASDVDAARQALGGLRAQAAERGWANLVAEIDVAFGQTTREPADRPAGPGGRLSPREAEVLALLAEGASNRLLAERLHISENTVERHLRNIFVKLGVANRAEAVARHLRHVGNRHPDGATNHGLP